MRSFQKIQRILKTFGLTPNQSKTNEKLVMMWLILSLGTIAGVAFLAFEAKTFQEYTDGIYTTSAGIVITALFTTLIFKKEKLFKLIDSFEKIITESELVLELARKVLHPDNFRRILK